MNTFEYKILDPKSRNPLPTEVTEADINALGAVGWRVVAAVPVLQVGAAVFTGYILERKHNDSL